MMPGCHPYITEFETMWILLRPHRPIAFGTRMARITGHPKQALLLSQLVYWTRRGRDVETNGGWVHKTREHWLLETGLSREEQENARRRLRELNLVSEWRGGQPARMHYRLEVDAISTAVRATCAMAVQLPASIEAMRADPFAGDALLGPTVAYRRIFVDLIGNVNAALLLSRMVQLQRREADRQCTWFTHTAGEWQRTLGLNRRQLDNARARLLRQGLIREFMRQCTGRRVFTQVNAGELKRQLERLASRGDMRERLATRKRLLAQSLHEEEGAAASRPLAVTPGNSQDEGASFSTPFSASFTTPVSEPVHRPPVCAGARACPNSPTGSRPLEAGLDANAAATVMRWAGLIRYRWRETCVPDARVYGRITYQTTTTPSDSYSRGHGPTQVVVGGSISPRTTGGTDDGPLSWPAMVSVSERSLVASHLARIPVADRQMLLDEMAAGHRHQPVQLPVAYIAGLVRRYLAGEFIPTRAHLERAARRQAGPGEGAIVASHSPQDPAGLPVSTRETACRHLAAIRDALRAGIAHRSAHRVGCHA
ncbi:hypothetical protein B0G76_1722 [Paraburkholderia sp. BL23I1N1]|uniref:hypothetical protein n=1 Tax=unclassified Paraburkholderia TaxID=2615204 RepID=UPI000E25FF14|nr:MULTISPECIES: hypothetical protein [unclassified Paraburkholderia]REE18596.1 hypothetical protein B0G71_1650 [Paraburkholderia sp. BL27I4N3]RKE35610.1 hypothetical protein B0G76_1722 [Paraburkholderia sp. BL23I1N1]TCK94675.1 hypothetical protein B0G74_1266 [Paraburkholderia sp. BL9I2N2]